MTGAGPASTLGAGPASTFGAGPVSTLGPSEVSPQPMVVMAAANNVNEKHCENFIAFSKTTDVNNVSVLC